LNYSIKWVYDQGLPTNAFSLKKELLDIESFDISQSTKYFESATMFPLNLVYATYDGHIGYHMNGLFPKRPYQVQWGVYPKKGWLAANYWSEFIHPKDLPRMQDPAEGFLVSANNIVNSKRSRNGISHGFAF
jgi:acyl-homoserine lactone acylase PvdQ